MTNDTESKLIKLNKEFYDKIGKHWNNKPDYFWAGWDKLLPYIKSKIESCESVSILDLGCGNGRFAAYLNTYFPDAKISYTGTDYAFDDKIKVSYGDNIKVKFVSQDLLQETWLFQENTFDIIVAFGLIHHIPGIRLTNVFLDNIQKYLDKNGLCVITTWQYMRLERLQKRIMTGIEKQEIQSKMAISESEFRPGDNFLDWVKGNSGVRFSHYFTELEMVNLLADHNLKSVETYLADDREQNRNQYFVIKKSVKNISI